MRISEKRPEWSKGQNVIIIPSIESVVRDDCFQLEKERICDVTHGIFHLDCLHRRSFVRTRSTCLYLLKVSNTGLRLTESGESCFLGKVYISTTFEVIREIQNKMNTEHPLTNTAHGFLLGRTKPVYDKTYDVPCAVVPLQRHPVLVEFSRHHVNAMEPHECLKDGWHPILIKARFT